MVANHMKTTEFMLISIIATFTTGCLWPIHEIQIHETYPKDGFSGYPTQGHRFFLMREPKSIYQNEYIHFFCILQDSLGNDLINNLLYKCSLKASLVINGRDAWQSVCIGGFKNERMASWESIVAFPRKGDYRISIQFRQGDSVIVTINTFVSVRERTSPKVPISTITDKKYQIGLNMLFSRLPKANDKAPHEICNSVFVLPAVSAAYWPDRCLRFSIKDISYLTTDLVGDDLIQGRHGLSTSAAMSVNYPIAIDKPSFTRPLFLCPGIEIGNNFQFQKRDKRANPGWVFGSTYKYIQVNRASNEPCYVPFGSLYMLIGNDIVFEPFFRLNYAWKGMPIAGWSAPLLPEKALWTQGGFSVSLHF